MVTIKWIFSRTPFGAPILEPDLDTRLNEVQLHGQRLSHKHVRIVAVEKGTLQLVQLPAGEVGAAAASFGFFVVRV